MSSGYRLNHITLASGERLPVFSIWMGYREESVAELLRIIDPRSLDNPWRDQHARYGNALHIQWLLNFRLRVGEAFLGGSDIVAYRKEVVILDVPMVHDVISRRRRTGHG